MQRSPAASTPPTPAPSPPGRARNAALARAEARGKQVLLYAPEGPLGGSFACSRCGASAMQPDLLTHAGDCPYLQPSPAAPALPVTPPVMHR